MLSADENAVRQLAIANAADVALIKRLPGVTEVGSFSLGFGRAHVTVTVLEGPLFPIAQPGVTPWRITSLQEMFDEVDRTPVHAGREPHWSAPLREALRRIPLPAGESR